MVADPRAILSSDHPARLPKVDALGSVAFIRERLLTTRGLMVHDLRCKLDLQVTDQSLRSTGLHVLLAVFDPLNCDTFAWTVGRLASHEMFAANIRSFGALHHALHILVGATLMHTSVTEAEVK